MQGLVKIDCIHRVPGEGSTQVKIARSNTSIHRFVQVRSPDRPHLSQTPNIDPLFVRAFARRILAVERDLESIDVSDGSIVG